MDTKTMRNLAIEVAASLGIQTGRPNHLRLVGEAPEAPSLTALQRDVVYSRIKDLGNMYWLNWLIRQECAHVLGVLECLSDRELHELLRKMELARECRVEGVAFDEFGLIKDHSHGVL